MGQWEEKNRKYLSPTGAFLHNHWETIMAKQLQKMEHQKHSKKEEEKLKNAKEKPENAKEKPENAKEKRDLRT